MRKFSLYILLLSLITLLASCNEEPPREDEKTIELQQLNNTWSLVEYETSTPSGNGAIVSSTKLDGSMCFSFSNDNSLVITSNDVLQAHGTYVLYESQNTLELLEYEFVDDVEPEGIALLLLPIVANNTLQIEELTHEVLTLSMPYSGTTRFIAYFVRK